MTHYTCHAHVETVGCLSWELASVCQLPSFGSAPEEPIWNKNMRWWFKYLLSICYVSGTFLEVGGTVGIRQSSCLMRFVSDRLKWTLENDRWIHLKVFRDSKSQVCVRRERNERFHHYTKLMHIKVFSPSGPAPGQSSLSLSFSTYSAPASPDPHAFFRSHQVPPHHASF